MLTAYNEVDNEGYIIDTHVLTDEDEIPSNYFQGWEGRSFYRPRWDFTAEDWVEDMTPEEIEAFKATNEPPSDKERIEQLEAVILQIMMEG